MSVVAGDVQEISWTHKRLGSGRLFPKAGEDSTFDTGGPRVDDDASARDGAGRHIKKINNKNWSYEGPVTWDMRISDELTKLSELAADPEDANWTIQHSNGTVWAGTGCPVGDLQGNGNAGTINLKLAGSLKLTKITG